MTNNEIIKLLKSYRTHLCKLYSHSEYNYQETRSFLNKNRSVVQRILVKAGTLHLISIAPPLYGGYVMNNINPLDYIFNPPYDMGADLFNHLSDIIEQAIGIIEADPDFSQKMAAVPPRNEKDYDIWALIHPLITEVSKKRKKTDIMPMRLSQPVKL